MTPPNPELADPSVLCGLTLPGKTRVYTAKTDLANAFFILRLPQSWQPCRLSGPVTSSCLATA